MHTPLYHASLVAYYGSEEAIIEGAHLEWFISYHSYYDYDWHYGSDNYLTVNTYELRTPDGYTYYVTLDETAYNNELTRRRHEEAAIRQQLNLYYTSMEVLNNTDGLLYSINTFQTGSLYFNHNYYPYNPVEIPRTPLPTPTPPPVYRNTDDLYQRSTTQDNNTIEESHKRTPDNFEPVPLVISNVDAYNRTVDYFKAQPVFFLLHNHAQAEHSSSSDYPFYYYWGYWTYSDYNENAEIYLAFTYDVVRIQNLFYTSARTAYAIDFSIIAACAILTLALIVVLMIGAGRRNLLVDGQKVRSQDVHFSPVDKIYLDIGLAFVIFWSVFIFFISIIVFDAAWRYRNITATNIITASAVLLTVPAALFWLLNLTKRIKAGHFWRHTLIYAVTFGSMRFISQKAKQLWAGTYMMVRIALISLASFITLFIVTAFTNATNSAFAFFLLAGFVSVVVGLMLTLYAGRIRNLEHGARIVSEGGYDIPVYAGGGELGRIAHSINSISAGINVAVEERMKSERLKTELITNVSHDIRTPLTSIITYTDLLEHEGLDCEKAPEYLNILKQKSLRLKTLTEELFEAAKATSGNIDVNLADLNIVSLINQVLGELDTTISASGLDLRVDLPDKLIAIADGRLMHRVMENLLSNAFKYSQPGSRVYLDVQAAANKEVRIDVKNISASALNFDPSELVERFKRGDVSRTDGGSGLGLSIVQSFVSAQNGRFEIKIDGDLFKATVILPVPM